jgi:hypothetical protein
MQIRTMKKKMVCLVHWLLALAYPIQPSTPLHKAGFSVEHDGIVSSSRLQTIMLLPGQSVALTISGGQGATYRIAPTSATTMKSHLKWQIQPPDSSGMYHYTLYQTLPADSIRIQIVVLVPYNHQKSMDGYNIGSYPMLQLGKFWGSPPGGMIQVTAANESLFVSPHLRLGQFLCKQAGDYPKYLVLQEKLIHKLELIIDKLAEKGLSEASLVIMSGFRTPAYNKAIGNGAYSQHCWGGAADIYIDANRDGHMDDLNHDGRCDFHDADALYQWIAQWNHDPMFASLLGGLAKYRRTQNHGPFVHVDVRGFNASWGE